MNVAGAGAQKENFIRVSASVTLLEKTGLIKKDKSVIWSHQEKTGSRTQLLIVIERLLTNSLSYVVAMRVKL